MAKLLILALLLGLAAQQQDMPEDEIVVIGADLRSTKVDYRLRGPRLAYCGPRDRQQNADRVQEICDRVHDCVLDGQRTTSKVSQCVNERLRRS